MRPRKPRLKDNNMLFITRGAPSPNRARHEVNTNLIILLNIIVYIYVVYRDTSNTPVFKIQSKYVTTHLRNTVFSNLHLQVKLILRNWGVIIQTW